MQRLAEDKLGSSFSLGLPVVVDVSSDVVIVPLLAIDDSVRCEVDRNQVKAAVVELPSSDKAGP